MEVGRRVQCPLCSSGPADGNDRAFRGAPQADQAGGAGRRQEAGSRAWSQVSPCSQVDQSAEFWDTCLADRVGTGDSDTAATRASGTTMLSIFDHRRTMDRRSMMTAGGLALGGLSLADLLRSQAAAGGREKPIRTGKSVVFLLVITEGVQWGTYCFCYLGLEIYVKRASTHGSIC